jgi:hypothetical protein
LLRDRQILKLVKDVFERLEHLSFLSRALGRSFGEVSPLPILHEVFKLQQSDCQVDFILGDGLENFIQHRA